MRESEVMKEVMAYLTVKQIYHKRQNTGRRGGVNYGFVGSPDIIGILPTGHFLGIECKGEGGKQSTDQKECQLNITANNALYILAYSVEDVVKGLNEYTSTLPAI